MLYVTARLNDVIVASGGQQGGKMREDGEGREVCWQTKSVHVTSLVPAIAGQVIDASKFFSLSLKVRITATVKQKCVTMQTGANGPCAHFNI